MTHIKSLKARQILDSRGNPTVEVDMHLSDGSMFRSAVPSGASTGSREAVELRDQDPKHFQGKGVLRAVANVNDLLVKRLNGMNPSNQREIDEHLIEIDGSPNKSALGANALLGISMATTRAGAHLAKLPLYEYIGRVLFSNESMILPTPMFNILNGGVHADSSLDFQEFMIAPVGASSVTQAVEMGAEIYQTLKTILKKKGYLTAVGDEGGFAPALRANDEAIELILEATTKCGFKPKTDVAIALDPAASEFFENGVYHFKKSDGRKIDSAEMIAYWSKWIADYPILSLEDGIAETDDAGWKLITKELGTKVQLVGDDNFVTNPEIIRKAIADGIANASLIKLNQIGTVSETVDAIEISKHAGYGTVISHRSGETSDDFISDLAVGSNARQMKTGAPARGERVAKYNQLMRIEEELGSRAKFAGVEPFLRSKEK